MNTNTNTNKVNSITEEARKELCATGKDLMTGHLIFEIETRPILYHQVSVWVNRDGARGQYVQPISADNCYTGDEGLLSLDLDDGETVVGMVPATPGSYSIYAFACGSVDRNMPSEALLGSVIAGDMNNPTEFNEPRWMRRGAMYAETYGWK